MNGYLYDFVIFRNISELNIRKCLAKKLATDLRNFSSYNFLGVGQPSPSPCEPKPTVDAVLIAPYNIIPRLKQSAGEDNRVNEHQQRNNRVYRLDRRMPVAYDANRIELGNNDNQGDHELDRGETDSTVEFAAAHLLSHCRRSISRKRVCFGRKGAVEKGIGERHFHYQKNST